MKDVIYWLAGRDPCDGAVYVYRTDRVRSLKLLGDASSDEALMAEARRIADRLNKTEGDER